MTMAYYNEWEDYPATFLENLIRAKSIAPGIVDRRSVVEVRPSDLKGFTQCHFFAGIGGWSAGLRKCEWRDRWPVWTISCPCQPWSNGRIDGRERGEEDERDLWPDVLKLIKACKPTTIFGEQVSGGIAKRWINRTRKDLKTENYHWIAEERRASDYGSPQIRERVYFSADVDSARSERLVTGSDISACRPWRWRGEEDLQSIAAAPFEHGDRWPKPMLRKGDDGLFGRMGRLRAYGNAVDPYIVAQFIADTRQRQGI